MLCRSSPTSLPLSGAVGKCVRQRVCRQGRHFITQFGHILLPCQKTNQRRDRFLATWGTSSPSGFRYAINNPCHVICSSSTYNIRPPQLPRPIEGRSTSLYLRHPGSRTQKKRSRHKQRTAVDPGSHLGCCGLSLDRCDLPWTDLHVGAVE